MALWVRSGAYCADHLTDGVIDPDTIGWLRGENDEIDELVRAGLWDEHPDGWEFHDWAEYQPGSAKVKAQREQTRLRVAEWRAQKDALTKENGSSSLPVPSRPFERGCNSVTGNAVTDRVTRPTPSPPSLSAVLAELERKVTADAEGSR